MKFTKINKIKGTESSTSGGSVISGGGGGGGTYYGNPFEPHYLWGQYFDDTRDIDGDITVKGDIYVNKGTDVEGNSFGGNIVTETNVTVGGDLDVTGNSSLSGDLEVIGEAEFESDVYTDGTLYSCIINNSGTIKTKNLEVTGLAHFFELTIDKIRSAGGAIMLTAADGFDIDLIEVLDDDENVMSDEDIKNFPEHVSFYKLYWRSTDSDGNSRDNMWKAGDQALCMSFNQAKTGSSHDVSNKYYWCLVEDASPTNSPVKINGVTYHYIEINKYEAAGTVNPEIGDTIVQCGYRGTDDEARQSAIYISAYSSIDQDIDAPFIAQYQGINDFDLSSHRKSYFDATSAKFVGDFEVGGQNVDDYINSLISSSKVTTYQYKAFAKDASGTDMIVYNSSDSSTDKTTDDSYPFVGICITTSSTAPTTPSSYTWISKGSAGSDAVYYYIETNTDVVVTDSEGNPRTTITANLYKIEGQTKTKIRPNYWSVLYPGSSNPTSFDYSNTSYTITPASGYSYVTIVVQVNSGNILNKTLYYISDGANGEDGENGDDAEFIKLEMDYALAVNTSTDLLDVRFKGRIKKIEGATSSVYTGFTGTLILTDNRKKVPLDSISIDVTNGEFEYTNKQFETQYSKIGTGAETYFTLTATEGLWTDSYTWNCEFEAGATLVIKQGLDNDIASITTRVSDGETRMSEIEQTASEISLKVNSIEDNLESTGIDIENHKITVTADNFEIDNNSGTKTFSIDSDGNIVGSGSASFKGNIEATGGYFSNDDGTWSISLNLDDKYIELDGADRFNASTGESASGSDTRYVRLGHSEDYVSTVKPSNSSVTYGVYAGQIELKCPTLNEYGVVSGSKKVVLDPYTGLSFYNSDGDTIAKANIGLGGLIVSGSIFFDDVPTVSGMWDSNDNWVLNTSSSSYTGLSSGQVFKFYDSRIGGTILMIK